MVKRKYNIWDIIAWVCVGGIFLWLILKVTGIINTPLLLQYAPYFGVAYILGWNVHKLENASKRLSSFEKFKDATIKEIGELKLNCTKNHK